MLIIIHYYYVHLKSFFEQKVVVSKNLIQLKDLVLAVNYIAVSIRSSDDDSHCIRIWTLYMLYDIVVFSRHGQ
jgi:hypothetical protein